MNILKIKCFDQKGLIYKISSVLYKHELNIEKNSEFVDTQSGKFFFRAIIRGDLQRELIVKELKELMPEDATITLHKQSKKRVILMATKESHALGDILLKHDAGELNAEILAVVSNYDDLRGLAEKFGIKYHYISHDGLSRDEHESRVLETLSNYEIDYIVLAKYMRILTGKFVKNYENKIINIHHSFLPAFIGANPYKQAYERGVKIIGATAHFVNDNLDEGPIIAQDVISVNHNFTWRDMQRAGRDVEKSVLSKALDLAFDDRIFIHDNKTVIF